MIFLVSVPVVMMAKLIVVCLVSKLTVGIPNRETVNGLLTFPWFSPGDTL